MSVRDAQCLETSAAPGLAEAADPNDAEFPALTPEQQLRFARMLNDHFAAVWRAGRRAGLGQARAEENAQEVFAIAARKLDRIEFGRERAYLLGIAVRLAQNTQRLAAFRSERAEVPVAEDRGRDTQPLAEDLMIRRQERRQLDDILQSMSEAFRTILTLYEIEELTLHEIAELLGIPLGTATSRLRRARAEFSRIVQRLSARQVRLEEER